MNHLSRLFSHRKESSMDVRRNARKPKLERRNAVKHFTYEAESTTSSSTDPSPSPSLHTRSLDLSDLRSFRLEGYDGEFERICKSLGLSGPDDFAIPAAEWNASKGRSSSDLLPRSRLNRMDSPNLEEDESEIAKVCDRVEARIRIEGEAELIKAELTRNDPPRLSKATQLTRNETPELEMNLRASFAGGIKGIRSPVLRPPPSIRIPPMDSALSTWDILRGLAPASDEGASKYRPDHSSSSEVEEEEISDGETVEREVESDMRFREAGHAFYSSSFTTSNEDDSSTTTSEPRSNNVSPVEGCRRIITRWEKGDLLGRGSFGSVYEGFSGDGFFFAVKEVSLLDKGSQGKQSVYQLEQEIALLSQFEHENIVQYYGTDKDESKLYIFLELVTKGSLASLYQRYSLRDSHVSSYTRQILHGLNYLHERKVVHRDIKCANILVHSSGSVKLADFGLAKAVRLNDVKSCKGTAFWMAPEVVRGKSHGYGVPADIWSLGCTVLEMLTGHFPYYPLECMQALYRIGKGEPPPVSVSLSEDARDFVRQCLKVNPHDRPSAAQLLNHPFVKRPLSSSSGSTSPHIGRQL